MKILIVIYDNFTSSFLNQDLERGELFFSSYLEMAEGDIFVRHVMFHHIKKRVTFYIILVKTFSRNYSKHTGTKTI